MKIIITEKQCSKILLTEGKVAENTAKQFIEEKVRDFKANKGMGGRINKWVDGNKLVDDFKNYLISQVPLTLELSKKGVNGQIYGYNSYKKILSLVETAFSDISWGKKKLIQAALPSKEKFLKEMKEGSRKYVLGAYLDEFKELLSEWIDISTREDKEYLQYKDNIDNYYSQIYTWFYDNDRNIRNEMLNKVINVFYD
jgi:hypothetical protein